MTTLQTWAEENAPDPKFFGAKGFWSQVTFVRDQVTLIFGDSAKTQEEFDALVQVVGVHRSKSILCPVYHLDIPAYGLKIWMRYNFHDWNVSVQAAVPLNAFNYLGIVTHDGMYEYCECEGMTDKKFTPINAGDPCSFTCCIASTYDVYTFLKALYHQLKNQVHYQRFQLKAQST